MAARPRSDGDAGGGEAGGGVVTEEKKESKQKFGPAGQVLVAVLVTAVAGSIVGARRFRKTMTDTVSRNAERRKAEAEQAERAARAARGSRGARGAGEAGRWSSSDGAYQDGNPLRGRIPKGWEFDDTREAAFKEQRLNSQVLQHLSTLGVKNFVAGSDEVKAAYRGKAMTLHPDRNPATKANERDFKKVAASYAWLDENYFRKRGV